MADKYSIIETGKYYTLSERVVSDVCQMIIDMPIAKIYCTQDIANLIDKCLNQTSRAGSKTSQAKRDAAKKNIAKRWNKNEHYAPHIDAPLDKE